MIQNRKGCFKAGSRIVFKSKSSIFWQFCPKKCAKVRSHIARPKKGRTHAHSAHFPEWISHAHAPSQLIQWRLVISVMKFTDLKIYLANLVYHKHVLGLIQNVLDWSKMTFIFWTMSKRFRMGQNWFGWVKIDLDETIWTSLK